MEHLWRAHRKTAETQAERRCCPDRAQGEGAAQLVLGKLRLYNTPGVQYPQILETKYTSTLHHSVAAQRVSLTARNDPSVPSIHIRRDIAR